MRDRGRHSEDSWEWWTKRELGIQMSIKTGTKILKNMKIEMWNSSGNNNEINGHTKIQLMCDTYARN